MTSWPEEAIGRLRRALGDTGDPPAFSDAELDALLDNTDGNELAARQAGLWELCSQMARFSDYTVGASQEHKSQIFDHLLALYRTAREDAVVVQETAAPGVAAGLLSPTMGVANRVVW